MVFREELDDWVNGNHTQIERAGLMRLAHHFERLSQGFESEVEDDLEN